MDNREIIYDIKRALEGGATLSALALALTIPDICNPGKRKEEYIKWYEEYVIKYLKQDEKIALSGEEVYAFRCAFLHEMNTQIDEQKVMKKRTRDHCFCVSNKGVGVTIRDADLAEDYIKICIPILIEQLLAGYNKFLECNKNFSFHIDFVDFD